MPKVRIRLSQLSTKVEVEFDSVLGNCQRTSFGKLKKMQFYILLLYLPFLFIKPIIIDLHYSPCIINSMQ